MVTYLIKVVLYKRMLYIINSIKVAIVKRPPLMPFEMLLILTSFPFSYFQVTCEN